MQLYQSSGTLDYSGNNRLVLLVDQELADYYRSLVPKYLPNTRQRYAAHITIVREHKEEVINREVWGKYQGEEIEFYYSPEVRFGEVYFWLNCFSKRFEEIRLELGLPVDSIYTRPPDGYFKTFHISCGNFK